MEGRPWGRAEYAKPLTRAEIDDGRHRRRAGGLWTAMGKLQLDFMVEHGLEPTSRLIDIGCGPLRAGIHFVDYLDPGNYYGIDVNGTLLDAGYDVELSDDLRAKLPRENLR